jgi:23S rRNA-/tRNA-specific pseudouridylate synthase
VSKPTHFIPPEGALRLEALWLFAKPAGLATHPSRDVDDDLLAWAKRNHGAPENLAPINRLDRATSGLVLASACPATRARFGEVFADHAVRKTYLALVHGSAPVEGRIDRALLDRRRGRKLDSSTSFRCRKGMGKLSLLEVHPVTGRKHQIRRHLRGENLPIVGDKRYGGRPLPTGAPDRLWLHCVRLELPTLQVETPLPAELQAHLEWLKSSSTALT